jgi:2-dehydropantoate 2-reductase
MRVCIFGAGAGGGHFAVRLARAGQEVSVVARGANLNAIRTHGLTLKSGGETFNAHPRAAQDATELGRQDVLMVTTKATSLWDIAPSIAPLVGPETIVIFCQNGMPWWYPIGLSASRPTPPDLSHFALGKDFLAIVEPDQLCGALVYSANALAEPGVIVNNSPGDNRIELGSVVDCNKFDHLVEMFDQAGIGATWAADIRAATWKKLLANMSGSVLALATGNKSSISRKDEGLGRIYRRLVEEGLATAAAHGYAIDNVDPEAMRQRTLDHKPSLLQDFEHRRPMELHEIVEAPLAFARAANVAAPTMEAVCAIVMRLAIDRGLAPSRALV